MRQLLSLLFITSLLSGCLSVQPTQNERPMPPFVDPQFGNLAMQVETMELHLVRPVEVLVLNPRDARSTDYVHLEDFWLQKAKMGFRYGQPYQIEPYLQRELMRVLAMMPDLEPLSFSQYKQQRHTDLGLKSTVKTAEVSFNLLQKEYQASVEMQFELMDAANQPLLEAPISIKAKASKDAAFTSPADPPAITPVLEQAFERAYQQLLYHNDFLLVVRSAARQ